MECNSAGKNEVAVRSHDAIRIGGKIGIIGRVGCSISAAKMKRRYPPSKDLSKEQP